MLPARFLASACMCCLLLVAVQAQVGKISSLSYDPGDQTGDNKYTVNVELDPVQKPKPIGGTVDNYFVTPSLPSGLNIDARTGVISGKFNEKLEPTSYTVTANNSVSSAKVVLTFEAAMGWMWILGAGLSVIGSVTSNLGINIQKYAFIKESAKEHPRAGPKMAMWWFGMLMVVLGSLGDFAALAFAAQSIVAPIGAVTLVANVFFAHFWLKEHLGCKDLVGTIFIIVGSVGAVAFGDHEEQEYTVEDLQGYYAEPGFLVYACSVACSIVMLYGLTSKVIEPIHSNLTALTKKYKRAVEEERIREAEVLDKAIYEEELKYARFAKVHPFAYCCLSGIFGGQNILFGKMVAVLLKKSLDGDNQMGNPLTWVFLMCMLCSIFCQLSFMAKALQSFDALYCVPVFQCFFITVSTLAGAAYFSEFARFNTLQWVMFPLGLCMTLFGVYLMSLREMEPTESRTVQLAKLSEKIKNSNSDLQGYRSGESSDGEDSGMQHYASPSTHAASPGHPYHSSSSPAHHSQGVGGGSGGGGGDPSLWQRAGSSTARDAIMPPNSTASDTLSVPVPFGGGESLTGKKSHYAQGRGLSPENRSYHSQVQVGAIGFLTLTKSIVSTSSVSVGTSPADRGRRSRSASVASPEGSVSRQTDSHKRKPTRQFQSMAVHSRKGSALEMSEIDADLQASFRSANSSPQQQLDFGSPETATMSPVTTSPASPASPPSARH